MTFDALVVGNGFCVSIFLGCVGPLRGRSSNDCSSGWFQAGLDVKSIARDSEAMKTLLYRPSGELANVAQACGYLWRQGKIMSYHLLLN